MLYAGPCCLTLYSDDAPDLVQDGFEVCVSIFEAKLGIGQDPDMNRDGLVVLVLCDASDLNGPVGLADRAYCNVIRVYTEGYWCEPSICEVNLGRVLGVSCGSILSGACDAPVGIEKVLDRYCWLDRTQGS